MDNPFLFTLFGKIIVPHLQRKEKSFFKIYKEKVRCDFCNAPELFMRFQRFLPALFPADLPGNDHPRR